MPANEKVSREEQGENAPAEGAPPPSPASTDPAQIPISDAAPQSESAEPSEEAIRLRAYFISELRRERSMPGDAVHDWIEARRELLEEGQV